MLAAVVITELGAVKAMGSEYAALKKQKISAEEATTITYDDKAAAVVIYGTDDPELTMDEFLHNSVTKIDTRIMSAAVVYTAVISALLSCFLYVCFRENRRKHILSVILCGVAVYIAILAATLAAMASVKVPVCLPTGKNLLAITVGLLGALAGNCAFALLLRTGKATVIISIAALIAVIATYLFGVLCEEGLYSAPTEISFAYLAEIEEGIFDDDYAGNAYVDDSKAVVVLNGTEYPQKECPNPAYYTGAKRVEAIIFEAVDPYAPFTLPLTAHDMGLEVPMLALLGYFIKSLLWILLPLFGKKKAKA